MSKCITVIGAGISGVSTAYMLAREGYTVNIYDRKEPASECSFANGGQISVSNSETWNSWSNVAKGMKWMFSKGAPLAMRFDHWSLDKVKWLARFLGAIPHQEMATRQTIEYALRSRELLKEVAAETEVNFECRSNGIMHIYRKQSSFDKAIETCEKYYDTNWGRLPVTLEMMQEIEPYINYEGIVGGTFTKDDFTGDIHRFTIELLAYMEREFDVKFIKGNIQALGNGPIVLCTGADTKNFVDTPIYPIKGYSVTYEMLNGPKTSILDDDAKIVSSTFDKRLRVAGTAELAGWNRDIREDRLNPLRNWAENLTGVTEEISNYACLRPMTPNMLPIIKKNGNVIINTGAGHLGWTMCMALAEKTVELINQRG